MKDGQVVRVVEIKAFPQAAMEEPEKPAATGLDLGMLLAMLLLLAIVVFGIACWKGRDEMKM